MKILTSWLRSYLPVLDVDDAQLAEDLTLRGIAVEGVFELNDAAGDSDDSLFDMDITTNRVDAMNHYGIAREAAAIYNLPLHALDATLPPRADAASFPVRIDPGAAARCGRFTAQVIRNVTIGETTGPVAHAFRQLGQRSISNAVDATNHVLLGMGQPTHAFDLDKVSGGIVVRLAHAGEPLRLLDGMTRTLTADDLVVADEAKALALAGVMGGWDSMITAETKNILVEAAWFAPAGIRASSRRHMLHTDASHRFERGADFAAAPVANALVCRQILAACGGELAGPMVDLSSAELAAETAQRAPIVLSVEGTQRLLGRTLAPEGITAALIERFLHALGCTLTPLDGDRYEVALPSWRLDLTREIDLVEEVARVYGYNGFADTLPAPGIVVAHPLARAMAAVTARLLALGYTQALSSSFASAAESARYAPAVRGVALENPLSEEAANLRPSLLPGMVDMLAHNLNRDVHTARLFEAGAVFAATADAVKQAESLALGLSGAAAASPLYRADDAPFYELKGAVEGLLALFATGPLRFAAGPVPAFYEPGRAACVLLGDRPIAHLGQLAAAEAASRKLRQPVYLAELNLERLLSLPLAHTTAQELSRFQAVERDLSFTFPEGMRWEQIAAAVAGLKLHELRSLRAVEIFRDATRMPGRYSLLMRMVFQSAGRTLTEAELAEWTAAVVAALEGLGGVQRSA